MSTIATTNLKNPSAVSNNIELVDDGGIRLPASGGPASASAAGVTGDIRWDSSYVYVCIAANTWRRAALSSW